MSVLTHRGWFGICPVYLGGIDADGPLVVARLWILEPLLTLSTWAFGVVIFFKALADPDFEAGFPIRITGPIHAPTRPTRRPDLPSPPVAPALRLASAADVARRVAGAIPVDLLGARGPSSSAGKP